MVLYNLAAMRIVRYRYRGNKMATSSNDVDAKVPGHRQLSFDETEFLGGVQESLVGC